MKVITAEHKFDIILYSDAKGKNIQYDLFHNTLENCCAVSVRVVRNTYTIKRTKTKIVITNQYGDKISEYTNLTDSFDCWDSLYCFLVRQLDYLSDLETSRFNKERIELLLKNNDNEKYTYLYEGEDLGYSIGIVGKMIVFNTPDNKQFSTNCYTDTVNTDYLQVLLDFNVKKDLIEKETHNLPL